MHEFIGKIRVLQDEIESALKDSDFEKLASLSTMLGDAAEALISSEIYRESITDKELVDLQNLLLNVQKYQEQTETKFRDYTSKVSRNQKMHQAYKQ